jgi:chaperonin GroEL (HSP60 family)
MPCFPIILCCLFTQSDKHSFSVADIIRSCLGPKAMLKMLLDPMGGIVLTNDGHAILREIEVAHPAAKSMIELSRTQDEEVGDGTTTVIILGMQSSLLCHMMQLF